VAEIKEEPRSCSTGRHHAETDESAVIALMKNHEQKIIQDTLALATYKRMMAVQKPTNKNIISKIYFLTKTYSKNTDRTQLKQKRWTKRL